MQRKIVLSLPTPVRSGATTRWQRGSPVNNRLDNCRDRRAPLPAMRERVARWQTAAKHFGAVDTLQERRSAFEFHVSAVVVVPAMHILPRVLVIAEDRAARRALRRFLQLDGYDVAVTANEGTGLEPLRTAPVVAVVLDLHGRGNSAARDVFRKIRQFAPRSPSLFWVHCRSQTQFCF